jgi:hypothetical protein
MLDRMSGFLAKVRGLPAMIGILLVIVNLVVQFIPPLEPLARTNVLLHLGVVIGLAGIMLARVL